MKLLLQQLKRDKCLETGDIFKGYQVSIHLCFIYPLFQKKWRSGSLSFAESWSLSGFGLKRSNEAALIWNIPKVSSKACLEYLGAAGCSQQNDSWGREQGGASLPSSRIWEQNKKPVPKNTALSLASKSLAVTVCKQMERMEGGEAERRKQVDDEVLSEADCKAKDIKCSYRAASLKAAIILHV